MFSNFSVQNTNSHLGNMLTRLTLGLPGRLEAGQRSKARLVQASLEGRVMFKARAKVKVTDIKGTTLEFNENLQRKAIVEGLLPSKE